MDSREITSESDLVNEYLHQMESDKNLTTLCLSKMIEAKDKLRLEFAEETKKVKSRAQEQVHKFFEEQEKLRNEFEASRKELDSWSRNINNDHEAFHERMKQKLDDEKQKVWLI
ncbi:factor of DNA methylation 2-like isoform X2 [Impatiens glandulifera]|uniref:factor of DNA methylation 2-like isoform X2 n=1 Tax=Impatiens glandulifera TaxID=253017 RepID=UPI001FB0E53A|nr:factor of DNA methylation 2-like isoform X2 [Impatiens glandulifera]